MTTEVGAILAGKYRVTRVLGQGGMGTVVEALHEELDQRVAIKLMAKEASLNAEWATRFSREARAAARIRSDHVVRVTDVGKLESGQPYMVMELLEGEDLQAMISRRGRVPIPQAIDFMLQTCEALAEAHANGIVHRDLKPANLFVTERGDEPWIKVLDFGISKVANDPGSVTVTNTSAIVGSPLYMSPEQMRASKSVDARTDIWALGVILQEMITGKPPFEGNTQPELCALVLTAPPSKMSASMPNVPPALEAVALKCLEKDPAQRFANVAELAYALAEITPTARTAADRIVRALNKGRQPAPSGVSLPAPETARVAITPDSPNATTDIGDTIASDKKPEVVRVVEGPTMLSAGVKKEVVAPTLVQQPLPAQAPQPPTSTAAAWGQTTGAPSPSRAPLFIAAGVVGLVAIGGVVAVALRAPHAPAAPSTAPSLTTSAPEAKTTEPPPTTNLAPSIASTVAPPATTSAKPIATTSARPTITTTRSTQGAASAPVAPTGAKPSSDTSEFGGRK